MSSKIPGNLNPAVIISAAIVAVVVLVAVWVNRDAPAAPEVMPVEEAAPVVQRIEIPSLPATAPNLAAEFQLEGEMPALGESDTTVQAHMQLLGGRAVLEWLAGEQLLRRIVVQVANAADGDLVYQQSPLVRQGELAVVSLADERFALDPASYRRYDAYVDFLANMQPDLLVAFYRYYEPLLDQAYAELGNPIGAFRGELLTAIEMVMAAPVLETPIELVPIGTAYEFKDQALEALPGVHKQLIRMGPQNTRRIQDTLRAFRDRIS